MSTRSAILRADEGGGRGVYHHYDGYPTGLGVTLLGIYEKVFDADHRAMTKYLIDDHPGGWSTIVSRDWTQEPGFTNTHDMERECLDCWRAGWQHYRQYYAGHGAEEPAGVEVVVLGHAPNLERPTDYRPQCYCHGDRSEGPHEIVCVDDPDSKGQGCLPEAGQCDPIFIEWAYRIAADGIYVWASAPGHDYHHVNLGFVAWGEHHEMAAAEKAGEEVWA